MGIIIYIYWTTAIIYILFIFFCWIGWQRIPVQQSISYNPSISVSIVIPARNEELNILNCLEDLAEQNYPAAMFEVIVVDDDSSDDTSELVNEFIEVNTDKSFRLIQLKEIKHARTYKKMAISRGIEEARGQLIVTTDADCSFSPMWISSIAQQYEITKAAMIAGPVCFSKEQTLFEKMQSLEFLGLIGIGAGSIRNGLYMICNGANLAYNKNAFHDVNGFEAHPPTPSPREGEYSPLGRRGAFASGDDIQLMLKIASKNTEKISFLKSKDAIVYTSAKNSLVELIQQRKRWASKIPQHTSAFTLFIASSAYSLHVGIIGAALWMIVNMRFSWLLFLPFAGKCFIELIFLFDVSRFFTRQKLLSLFLPAQIIYPFYIVIIGAIAPFGTYLWKERKVK